MTPVVRSLRLLTGAALLLGAAPLAAPSYARCAPEWEVYCTTMTTVCRTVEEHVIDPRCPLY